MPKARGERNASRQTAQFQNTVRAILVVLERLAAHAGVESNELDLLVEEFFNGRAPQQPIVALSPDKSEGV